ncbi:MAG: LysR family transcriptional regulator [Acholeplasmatales bacterium]|nr:LysR family transcriptional regulator [Acholeplasmatales bacterium]
MDLKELSYFKSVVDEGSILKASKVLHIAQPPLSRMMKSLENELETTLFIRGKQLRLTEQGKLLYEKAITILALSNTIKDDLDNISNKNKEVLNIGTVSSSTSLLYGNKLRDFYNKYNHTTFKITEANTFKLLDLLDKRIIDLAITRTPFDKEIYDYILLEKEPMVFTSNDMIDKNITLNDVSKYDLVVYRRFYDTLKRLFKENDLNFNVKALVDDAKTAILLAKSLNLHAIVPEGAYKTLNSNLYSSIIDSSELYTSLAIIKRKNEELPEIYKNLIEYLKK